MIIKLIVLFFAHWLGDYTHLSLPSMLAAKRLGKPLSPIILHASVHCFLTTISLLIIGTSGVKIAIGAVIMLVTHFGIDVWKGKMNVWFPSLQNPANVFHWWVFGIDQYLHAIVIITIASIT